MVIPVYNRVESLGPTLASVLDQEGPSFEVIVVDDGSSDDLSARTVARLEDPRVRLVRQPNGGVSLARNRGAVEARGPLLVFVDVDDIALPGWLSGLAGLCTDASVAAAYCAMRVVQSDGATSVSPPTTPPFGPLFAGISGPQLPGAFAIRRDVFTAIGGYEARLRYSENTELHLRLADHLATSPARTVSTEAVLFERHVPAHSSYAYSDDARLTSAMLILERHHDRLRRDRRVHAIYHGLVGVSAMRLGQRSLGLANLSRAALIRPRDPRNLGRLLIALVPPLRRRRWGSGAAGSIP